MVLSANLLQSGGKIFKFFAETGRAPFFSIKIYPEIWCPPASLFSFPAIQKGRANFTDRRKPDIVIVDMAITLKGKP
jgi:hypothetical protein